MIRISRRCFWQALVPFLPVPWSFEHGYVRSATRIDQPNDRRDARSYAHNPIDTPKGWWYTITPATDRAPSSHPCDRLPTNAVMLLHSPAAHLTRNSRIPKLSLPLRCSDVRIVYLSRLSHPQEMMHKTTHLGCELQTSQSLAQMRLQRANHYEHQRFRITAQ